MSYFITNVSLSLLIKELLKSANIWRSYSANIWLCTPFALCYCPEWCRIRQITKITCLLWTETVTNCCYVIGRFLSAYYQQISNCCRPVLTYWLDKGLLNGCVRVCVRACVHACVRACVRAFVRALHVWLVDIFLNETDSVNIWITQLIFALYNS